MCAEMMSQLGKLQLGVYVCVEHFMMSRDFNVDDTFLPLLPGRPQYQHPTGHVAAPGSSPVLVCASQRAPVKLDFGEVDVASISDADRAAFFAAANPAAIPPVLKKRLLLQANVTQLEPDYLHDHVFSSMNVSMLCNVAQYSLLGPAGAQASLAERVELAKHLDVAALEPKDRETLYKAVDLDGLTPEAQSRLLATVPLASLPAEEQRAIFETGDECKLSPDASRRFFALGGRLVAFVKPLFVEVPVDDVGARARLPEEEAGRGTRVAPAPLRPGSERGEVAAASTQV